MVGVVQLVRILLIVYETELYCLCFSPDCRSQYESNTIYSLHLGEEVRCDELNVVSNLGSCVPTDVTNVFVALSDSDRVNKMLLPLVQLLVVKSTVPCGTK